MSTKQNLSLVLLVLLPYLSAATSQPTTQATSQPTTQQVRKPARKQQLKPTKTPLPKAFGLLSIFLPKLYQVTVNGHSVGPMPVHHLRLGVGQAKVRIKNTKSQKTVVRIVPIRRSQHVMVVKYRGALGFRFARGEEHHILVRSYLYNRQTSQAILAPGKHCIGGICRFLFPGERVYQQQKRLLILPSSLAEKMTLGYRKKAGDGFLSLYSFPLGILYVDGKIKSRLPVTKLPLSPGNHLLEVKNSYLGLSFRKRITIAANEETRLPAFLTKKGDGHIRIVPKKPQQLWVNGFYRGWSPNLYISAKEKTHIRLLSPAGKVRNITLQVQPNKEYKVP